MAHPFGTGTTTLERRTSDEFREVGGFRFHAYQQRISLATLEALIGRRSGIVMAPTGSGKSLMICALIEDAAALGRPVLVLHHSMSLLRQNAKAMRRCPPLADVALGLVVARNFKGARHLGETTTENGFDEAVTFATFGSLRERFGLEFRSAVKRFAERGGIVIVDEGEKAGAEVLSSILQEFAEAGCQGYLYSATPFRMDGRDPLEAFGTTIGESLIGVAGHNEVLATGQIVPTVFRLAHREYVDFVTTIMMRRFVSVYSGFLSDGESPERATEKAFNKFLRSADPGDVAIADKLIEGVGFMWKRYVGSRRLTMIHCAGIDHAERTALHMASFETSADAKGVKRHLKVAVVNGSDCYLMRGNERISMSDLGKGLSEVREIVLEYARSGHIDVIVNVDALTSGVDIPLVDLTIFATFFRTAASAKQGSGRGERSLPHGPKADHLLLDLGITVSTLFRGIEMASKGLQDPSRNAMHEVDHRIRVQFYEWMEGDSSIHSKVEAVECSTVSLGLPVERDDVRKGPAKAEIPLDAEYLVALCRGVFVDDSRRSKAGVGGPSAFHAKTFMLCDFVEIGLSGADGLLPRFCGVVYDNETNEAFSFFHADREEVIAFARYAGCVSTNRDWLSAAPTSDRQAAYANARPVDRDGKPTGAVDWLPAFCRDLETFSTQRQVAIVADFKGKTVNHVFASLLDALGSRLFEMDLGRPVRVVLLDSCSAIEPGRWDLLKVYLRLFGFLCPMQRWSPPAVMVARAVDRDLAGRKLDEGVRVVTVPEDPADREALRRDLLENVVAPWSGSRDASDPWAFALCGLKGAKLDRVLTLRKMAELVLKDMPRELVDHRAGVYGKMSVLTVDVNTALELRAAGMKPTRGRPKGSNAARALARLGDAVTAKPSETKRSVWKTFPSSAVSPQRDPGTGVSNRGLGWMQALGPFGHEGGRFDLLVDFGRLRRDLADMPVVEQDKFLGVLEAWITEERYRLTAPSSRVSSEIR